MKIITHEDGYVDLEAPINMSDEQIENFISFMKSLFPGIEVEDIEEPIKDVGDREITQKNWTVDELTLLLGPNDNDELATKMGRTSMSVLMQRGHFVPEFMVWAKKKGYTYTPKSVDKKLVEKFVKERSSK